MSASTNLSGNALLEFLVANKAVVMETSEENILFDIKEIMQQQIIPGDRLLGFQLAWDGLTGTLTLNDQGNSNAQFIFQIGSTLTTASNSSVVTIGSGSTPDCNIFWQVGTSATVGTGTAFEGHILASASITMNTSATITDGSALARNGAVTLDTNTITNCAASISSIAAPQPATLPLVFLGTMLLGLPAMAINSRKRRLR